MSPWGLLAAVVVAGAALVGSYVQGRKDGRDVCQAQEARDKTVAQIAGAAAAASSAEAISKIEVQHVTIRQKTDTRIMEVPVYRDCRHPPDVLRDINTARTGRAAEPAGGGQLPAASGPGR